MGKKKIQLFSRSDIKHFVLRAIQEVDVDESASSVTEETIPIRDLSFDSMDGLEMACALSEMLKVEIPDGINPLFNQDSSESSVSEIIDYLERLVHE